MIPVLFSGCAGWLHQPPAGQARDRAVVLCPPFGYENLCNHRNMQRLAEQLAAAGLTVLRYDYPGTGDSAGDEAPNQVARWMDSIGTAMEWLRTTSGIHQIGLCGLRLGALLAAEYARRSHVLHHQDVDSLVLLSPVMNGRGYARELTLASRLMAENSGTATTDDPDWLEVAGHRLHSTDLKFLGGLKLKPDWGSTGARRVLLMPGYHAPSDLPPPELGTVQVLPLLEAEKFQRHSQDSSLPADDFAALVAWLATGAAPLAPATGTIAELPSIPELPIGDDIVEQALRFGPGGSRFGVLCAPRADAVHTAVLLLNTGANLHTGIGRHHVRLARQLAARGIASFRMDTAGIGEAAPELAAEPVPLYRMNAVDDTRAALDLLQQHGYAESHVVGVCSGAYLALHTALRDARVKALTMVNLQFFYWAPGDPASPWWRRLPVTLREMAARTRRWRTRYGLRRTSIPHYTRISMGLRQAVQRLRQNSMRLRHTANSFLFASAQHAEQSLGEAQLAGLQARGVDIALVFSQNDPGIAEFEAHFGPQGVRFRQQLGDRLHYLAGKEHSLAPRAMQDELTTLIERQICRWCLPCANAPQPATGAPTTLARAVAAAPVMFSSRA